MINNFCLAVASLVLFSAPASAIDLTIADLDIGGAIQGSVSGIDTQVDLNVSNIGLVDIKGGSESLGVAENDNSFVVKPTGNAITKVTGRTAVQSKSVLKVSAVPPIGSGSADTSGAASAYQAGGIIGADLNVSFIEFNLF